MVILCEDSWDECLTNYVWDNTAKYKDENASADLICCYKNLNIGYEHDTCKDEIATLSITAKLSINGTAASCDCLERKDCNPETFNEAISELS